MSSYAEYLANLEADPRTVVIHGRPDLGCQRDREFGKTPLKRFPPYVYSKRGALVHRVLRVEAHWYEAAFDKLLRLQRPRLFFMTVCGQCFFERKEVLKSAANSELVVCALPAPGATLCGRCQGKGPVFRKHGRKNWQALRAAIGCAVEVAQEETREP